MQVSGMRKEDICYWELRNFCIHGLHFSSLFVLDVTKFSIFRNIFLSISQPKEKKGLFSGENISLVLNTIQLQARAKTGPKGVSRVMVYNLLDTVLTSDAVWGTKDVKYRDVGASDSMYLWDFNEIQ